MNPSPLVVISLLLSFFFRQTSGLSRPRHFSKDPKYPFISGSKPYFQGQVKGKNRFLPPTLPERG
jgi:hypothetical protein